MICLSHRKLIFAGNLWLQKYQLNLVDEKNFYN